MTLVTIVTALVGDTVTLPMLVIPMV